MRVLFAGTPQVAATSLHALLESKHEVIAVLTRPDAATGRGRPIRGHPVAALAAEAGISVLMPGSLRDPVFVHQLRDLAPDCCPVVAYGGLIPLELLGVPRCGWVNLHFSLLPAWRGAAPVQWAVLSGDEVTGATTFVIEKGLDTGPILGSVTLAIGPTDTTGDLLDLLAEVGSSLLIETLDGLDAGGLMPIAQGNEGVSLAPKLQPIDARIVWSQPLAGIDRLIRATTPNPGSWTTLGGERVKIAPLDNSVLWPGKDPRPGHIEILDGRVWVGTDSFPAALTQVQPAGKKLMDAADWLRGLRSMSPAFE